MNGGYRLTVRLMTLACAVGEVEEENPFDAGVSTAWSLTSPRVAGIQLHVAIRLALERLVHPGIRFPF